MTIQDYSYAIVVMPKPNQNHIETAASLRRNQLSSQTNLFGWKRRLNSTRCNVFSCKRGILLKSITQHPIHKDLVKENRHGKTKMTILKKPEPKHKSHVMESSNRGGTTCIRNQPMYNTTKKIQRSATIPKVHDFGPHQTTGRFFP